MLNGMGLRPIQRPQLILRSHRLIAYSLAHKAIGFANCIIRSAHMRFGSIRAVFASAERIRSIRRIGCANSAHTAHQGLKAHKWALSHFFKGQMGHLNMASPY